MKLWLLRRIDLRKDETRYDENYGFVIRAQSAKQARALANLKAVDEGPGFWADPEKAKCTELTAEGEGGIILQSFNAG